MGKIRNRHLTLLRATGNMLIILSVVGFLAMFYPLIREELSYQLGNHQTLTMTNEDFGIRIASIGVSGRVIKDVDPFDEQEYRKALQSGIAHAETSVTPDEKGTVYLFAHSSDAPWRLARYNTAFFRLRKMKVGDEVVVSYDGTEYVYKVTQLVEVWPNEVEYLTETDEDRLILQTCTPIGTDFKRLLVFAEPM